MLKLVLENKFVTYASHFVEMCSGLSTGLSFCTALANAYLKVFNQWYKGAMQAEIFFRYVDDGLTFLKPMLGESVGQCKTRVLRVVNSFSSLFTNRGN